MSEIERILIDPTLEVLLDALTAVATHRNGTALPWPPTDLADFRAAHAAQPQGHHQWHRTWPHDPGRDVVLAVAWWSDLLGRKHVRMLRRDRLYIGSRVAPLILGTNVERPPPLWMVYPEHVCLRATDGAPEAFATCRCGAAGPPESLGWMGDVCGPCHDRREAAPPGQRDCQPLSRRLPGMACELRFTPDGRLLYLDSSKSFSLRLLDWAKGRTRSLPPQAHVRAFAVSPNGATVAAAVAAAVTLTDVRRGRVQRTLPQSGGVRGLAFSPDGTRLAALRTGDVILWDLRSDRRHGWEVRAGPFEHDRLRLAFTPDGTALAVATGDGTVRIFDTAGQERRRLNVEASAPAGLAFSPDGRRLAYGGRQPYKTGLRLWSWPDAVELSLRQPPKVSSLTFVPGSAVLVINGFDGWLGLWDAETGKRRATYHGHPGAVPSSVAASPDGRWLATSCGNRFLKIWPLPALLS